MTGYRELSPVEEYNAARFAGLLSLLDLPADTRRDDVRIPRRVRLGRACDADRAVKYARVGSGRKSITNPTAARALLTVADALEATR